MRVCELHESFPSLSCKTNISLDVVGLSTPQVKMPTLHMNLSKLTKIKSGPKNGWACFYWHSWCSYPEELNFIKITKSPIICHCSSISFLGDMPIHDDDLVSGFMIVTNRETKFHDWHAVYCHNHTGEEAILLCHLGSSAKCWVCFLKDRTLLKLRASFDRTNLEM
jgi:hypothetical protein